MMSTPEPTPPQSPLRWLIFLGVTIFLAVMLLVLPASIKQLVFLLIMFVALTFSIRLIILQLVTNKEKFITISQRHPLLYPRISFVITCILIGLATYFYQPQFADTYTGFYLLVAGLPFLRLSFPLLSSLSVPATRDDPPSTTIRWLFLGIALISLCLLIMMNIPDIWVGSIHRSLGIDHATPQIQILTLAVGIASLWLGFGVRIVPQRPTWQRHHVLLMLIVVLGAFMRLWNLEHAIRMFVDEMLFIRGINGYQTDIMKILVPVANAFTDVFAFFQYAVKQLIGPGLSALRIPSAVFGVLSVVGVYALARQLFSLRTALISALLLAVMPVHVHFSRIGLNNIAGATVAIWVFVYVLRGMRHRRLTDFAIAGTLLGLTHYFYEGERLFVTPFLVCWLIWVAVLSRKSDDLRFPQVRHVIVLVCSFLVIAVPVYHALISHERSLTERLVITRESNAPLEQELAEAVANAHPADLGYPIARYVQYDADGAYYPSRDAFVLPMLVPFFLIGFGFLLWKIRTHGGALLIWWAVGIAIGNSLIFDHISAIGPRYVLVYGILMMMTAVGVSVTWSLLSHWVGERFAPLINVGFAALLIMVSVYSNHYYFNDTIPRFYDFIFTRPTSSGEPAPAVDDMILRAVALPSNTDVHVFTETLFPRNLLSDIPYYYDRDADEFAVYHWFVQQLDDGYFLELPRDRNYVFTFTRQYNTIVEDIERYFTITRIEGSPFDNIPETVEMLFYYAPLEANRTLPDGSPLPDVPLNPRYRQRIPQETDDNP